MKFSRIIENITIIILLICILLYIFEILKTQREAGGESGFYRRNTAQIPNKAIHMPEKTVTPNETAQMQNQTARMPNEIAQFEQWAKSLLQFQNINRDVVGRIMIPGINIDYPFVQYTDNDYYLHRNLMGDESISGTVFMDYRCNGDLSSPNTILYGHNMKNGSMFGSIKKYGEKDFLSEETRAFIILPHHMHALKIFACAVVREDDEVIYSTKLISGYSSYVMSIAQAYIPTDISDSDRIITLSTCVKGSEDMRMVLIAKIDETYAPSKAEFADSSIR